MASKILLVTATTDNERQSVMDRVLDAVATVGTSVVKEILHGMAVHGQAMSGCPPVELIPPHWSETDLDCLLQVEEPETDRAQLGSVIPQPGAVP